MELPYAAPTAPPACCPEDLGQLSSVRIACAWLAGSEDAPAACSFPNAERLRASRLRPPKPYDPGMSTVRLPPDLEPFATEAVVASRHRTVSEVVAAAVILLQRRERAHAELLVFVLKPTVL